MRPRRGFDRPPEEPRTRINEAIRVPQVRLIGADGEQIGVKDRDDALEFAWNQNLDLVEVAADARPPVCRVMDYSKYKYEQEQKAKLARKHQNVIVIKEIKLRPKVGVHDYETKKGHVVRFLKNHDKVKVTIMFRGREMTHPEKGRELLLRMAEDLKEIAVVESEPLQDGRNMVMMLAPSKALLKEGASETDAKDADTASAADTAAPAPKAEKPTAAVATAPAPVVEKAPVVEAEPAPVAVEAPVVEEAAPVEAVADEAPAAAEEKPVKAAPKRATTTAAKKTTTAAKAPAAAKKTTTAAKAPAAAKKPAAAAKATTTAAKKPTTAAKAPAAAKKPTTAAKAPAAEKKTPTTRAKKAASASETDTPSTDKA